MKPKGILLSSFEGMGRSVFDPDDPNSMPEWTDIYAAFRREKEKPTVGRDAVMDDQVVVDPDGVIW